MIQSRGSKTATEQPDIGKGWPEALLTLVIAVALLVAGLGQAAAVQQKREGEDEDLRKIHLALEASQAEAALPVAPERAPPSSAAASSDASPGPAPPSVVFQPEGRAVSNWRAEARDNLDVSVETRAALNSSSDAPAIPRCVKLNNYWCIKRARWAGEIAADAEGHVAFASALDGAVAAAMLLRRYYIGYSRRSALAIVSRWAPAQCGGAVASAGKPRAAKSGGQLAVIAPQGIQHTLRARWLSTHQPGLSPSIVPRRSVVPLRHVPMMRAPEIAVGMGEARGASIKIAALDFAAPTAETAAQTCSGETVRIQNYAWRAIEGIVPRPGDDMQLFSEGGEPGANLLRLLDNMAKVEIGPLAPRVALIADAVARLPPKALAEGFPPALPAKGMSEALRMGH